MGAQHLRRLEKALREPEALQRSGDLHNALAGYLRVAAAFPGDAEPLFRVGLVHAARNTPDAAEQAIRGALALDEQPKYLLVLGDVLEQAGRREEALQVWQRAIELNPGLATAYSRLGMAYYDLGQTREAVSAFETAISLAPDSVRPRWNLVTTLLRVGHRQEAVSALKALTRIAPGDSRAWETLGGLLLRGSEIIGAREAFARAVELTPGRPGAWLGLANCDTHFGRTEEVLSSLEHAEQLCTADASQIGSQRLIAVHYSEIWDADATFKAHIDWARRYADSSDAPTAFPSQLDPEKRLRIGYLSPRFHESSISPLLVPVLESHDQKVVEIYCYASQDIEDHVTSRVRAASTGWRPILNKPDEAVASQIREDEIDILIDLAGHTPGHRLSVMAMRPAPLLVTWLDYFDTTGVETVDFLISDAVHSPAYDRQKFVENLIRMPVLRYCWEPPAFAPDVAIRSVAQHEAPEAPVFGCFNRLAKVSEATLDAWCTLLRKLPRARLVLKNSALQGEAEREEVASWFGSRGVHRDRLSLRGSSSYADMLAEYHEIDIALDTFPYNGGLTTLDALWMGKPVVTLQGDSMIGRQSQAILCAIGLADLCARDVPGYIALADALARDRPALAKLSGGLRDRVMHSPITDAKGFTRALERILREKWRQRCASAR